MTCLVSTQSMIDQSRDPRDLLMCNINTKYKNPNMFQIQSSCTNFPYATKTVNLVHLGHQIVTTAPRNLHCASTKSFIHNVITQVSIPNYPNIKWYDTWLPNKLLGNVQIALDYCNSIFLSKSTSPIP